VGCGRNEVGQEVRDCFSKDWFLFDMTCQLGFSGFREHFEFFSSLK